VHWAAVAIVVCVLFARRFDPWLRLTAGAALAQHSVALFYGGAIRYFFLAWFLTMLVVAVWCEQIGAGWFARRWPRAAKRVSGSTLAAKLSAGLACAERGLGLASARTETAACIASRGEQPRGRRGRRPSRCRRV
jgi:hypothetical protein